MINPTDLSNGQFRASSRPLCFSTIPLPFSPEFRNIRHDAQLAASNFVSRPSNHRAPLQHRYKQAESTQSSSQEGHMRNRILMPALFAALALSAPARTWASQRDISDKGEERIVREVHHELVMLPFYGVFDNLAYKVEGATVTLLGQVTRPTLKSDAEAVVKKIEGVEQVNNQIEVLPLSTIDDRIRLAEYRAIYGKPPLDRYARMAIPPVHIIVKGGHVTLEGVIGTEMDKNVAVIRAKGVSGVFSVTDNLRVGP